MLGQQDTIAGWVDVFTTSESLQEVLVNQHWHVQQMTPSLSRAKTVSSLCDDVNDVLGALRESQFSILMLSGAVLQLLVRVEELEARCNPV